MSFFAIWVNWTQSLHEGAMLGGLPLCSERALEAIDYTGELVLLAPDYCAIATASVKSMHVQGKAAAVFMSPPHRFSTPFLLTNDLQTRAVFDSPIEFDVSDRYKGLLSSVDHLPVSADHWMGVVTVQRMGLFRSHTRYHLTAFSSNPAVEVKAGEVRSPSTESLLGRISLSAGGTL